jgi:hypothetical protein
MRPAFYFHRTDELAMFGSVPDQPNDPDLKVFWDAKMILLLLLLLAVFLMLAEGPPIVRGWHLGRDPWTDNACETRLGLQWCGRAERGSGNVPSEVGAEQIGQGERAIEHLIE